MNHPQGHKANYVFAPKGAWQSGGSASKKRLEYEPFGSLLPGRSFAPNTYRYLFQGQEHDDEMHGATGTSYAYKYRMHDARIGRFLSIDPLASTYPWNSPYAFAENKVIQFIELEGLEAAYSDAQGHAISGSDHFYNGNPKYDPSLKLMNSKSLDIPAHQVYLPRNNSQVDIHVGFAFNTTPVTGVESGVVLPGMEFNTRDTQAPARPTGMVERSKDKSVFVSEPTQFGFDLVLFSVDERRQKVTETNYFTGPSGIPLSQSTSTEERTLDISIGPFLWSQRDLTTGGKTIESSNQIGIDLDKGIRIGPKGAAPFQVGGGVEIRTP